MARRIIRNAKNKDQANAPKALLKARGRKSYSREELISRKIDNTLITNYITLNSHLTPEELIDRLRNENVSTLEGMVIKAMLRGYRYGDVHTLNFFFERLVGKVPNEVSHTVKNPFKEMSTEQLMEEKKRLEEENRKSMHYYEQTSRFQQLEDKARDIIESTPDYERTTTPGEPSETD